MKNVKETVEKVYGNYPERILQFGEGNFLRAFVDWMVDKANEMGVFKGSIVLCQPIANGLAEMINAQDGVYTLAMRGSEDGKAQEHFCKITSVSRCINPYQDYDALMELAKSPDLKVIVSNTTEAGIAYHEGDKLEDRPPVSYPAKLCAFLYERFKEFGGGSAGELLILPVELIDNNGANLKRIVQKYADEWELGGEFTDWLEKNIHFTSTLVDRIVTGYPRDEIKDFEEKLCYTDNLLVTSELFNLWVIEGKKEWAEILPVHKTDANVLWTDDVTPYKKRKVRILNGAHTGTVPAAWLSGHNIVLDFMNDPVFRSYLDKLLFEEIIPTLDLPKEELQSFANAVSDRFANPFIKHRLLDISLNCCSKFCARCLPSLLGYQEQFKKLPQRLTFALAAFIAFYKGQWKDGEYIGKRADGTEYQIRDDRAVLEFFSQQWASGTPASISAAVLGRKEFWNDRDLTEIPGLADATAGYLEQIEAKGARAVVESLQ